MFWIWLLLGLVAIPVLVVCLPIRVVLAGCVGQADGLGLEGSIGLLAGLIGARGWYGKGREDLAPAIVGWAPWKFQVGARDRAEKPEKKQTTRGRKEAEDDEADEVGWRTRLPRLRARWTRLRGTAGRMQRPLWRLCRRLIRSVSLRKLEGQMAFGLDDPADTGRAYGLMLAVIALLGRRVSLQIQPEFLGPVVSGNVRLRLWVWPVTVIWALLIFGARLGIVWLLESRNYRRRLRRLAGPGPAPSPAA